MDDFRTLLRNVQLITIVAFVSFTVLLFDHCLTFTSEIEHIWRKRMTPFSSLFLLSRYFALSAMVVWAVLYLPPAPACSRVDCGLAGAPILFALSVVTTLAAEAMLILRVYAVYGNNKLTLFLLSSVWIVHLFLQIWVYATSHLSITASLIPIPDHSGKGTLIPNVAFSESKSILFVIPAVVFDAIVGGLLTLGLYRRSGPYTDRMPLTTLIIQDGLLYFVVVFASNILWILAYALVSELWAVQFFTPLEIWSGCITTTMISRLTLNLRMYNPTGSNELTFQTMSLRFRHTRQHTIVVGQTINEDDDH